MNCTITADATTAAAIIRDDDIIEIDAGGKVIKAFRSTLTLATDSMFASMFSGRWEGSLKYDINGRIFLDEDPELIETIINYLRRKKREDPSNPIQSPPKLVHEEKTEEFISLLDYYGLTPFFYQPSSIYLPLDINIDTIEVVKSNSSNVNMTKISQNKIQFSTNGTARNHFVACKKPPLDSSSEEGSFWKVTIDTLQSNVRFFLGIIGNLNASNKSFLDSTSYGWSNGGPQVWVEGTWQDPSQEVRVKGSALKSSDGWIRFTRGECLYFHLKSNTLTMYSVQKNKRFTINNIELKPENRYYIHFSVTSSGKFTLEPLNEEERALILH